MVARSYCTISAAESIRIRAALSVAGARLIVKLCYLEQPCFIAGCIMASPLPE
jgi:hypothetical protein